MGNKSNRGSNLDLVRKEDEPFENFLFRFKEKMKSEEVMRMIVHKSPYSKRYEKPSDKKRREKKQAIRQRKIDEARRRRKYEKYLKRKERKKEGREEKKDA